MARTTLPPEESKNEGEKASEYDEEFAGVDGDHTVELARNHESFDGNNVKINFSFSGDESLDAFGDTGKESMPTINGVWRHPSESDNKNEETQGQIRGSEINVRNDSTRLNKLMRMSSMRLSDVNEEKIDEKRIGNAVRDAGQYANGIVAAEVWIFDEESNKLLRPSGGWWLDKPITLSLINSGRSNEVLNTFKDTDDPDFVSTKPVSPGVDLAGELWAEQSSAHRTLSQSAHGAGHTISDFVHKHTRQGNDIDRSCHEKTKNAFSMEEAKRSITGSLSYDSRLKFRVGRPMTGHNHTAPVIPAPIRQTHGQHIIWRDIHSLVSNPDQAQTSRLISFEKAGLGKAAGVQFDVSGHRGMVIYFARSTEKYNVLKGLSNQVYMTRMAEVVGAIVASTDARRAAVASRGVRSTDRSKDTFEDDDKEISPNDESAKTEPSAIRKKVRAWLKKSRGGDLQIPPPMPMEQTLWTTFGVFFGLLLISAMYELIAYATNEKYYILTGPIGALVTLQYGLTAAPASQPRNIVLGQSLAGAISLLFTYIPDYVIKPWIRRAIAPAVSIGTIAKLGIIHPPAGAASILLASGQYGWIFYLLIVAASIVSLLPAVLINNMSTKRQYPTYWGMFYPLSASE